MCGFVLILLPESEAILKNRLLIHEQLLEDKSARAHFPHLQGADERIGFFWAERFHLLQLRQRHPDDK
jgi:hypothetical protein